MTLPKKSTMTKVAAIALSATIVGVLSACACSKTEDNANNVNNSNNQQAVSNVSASTSNSMLANVAETNPDTTVIVPTIAENQPDTPGSLNRIPSVEDPELARVPDFQIGGMALAGNQHDNAVTYSEKYKTEGIQSNFNLNEWIYMYLDDSTIPLLSDDSTIIVLPHQDIETYKTAQIADLVEIANSSGGFICIVDPVLFTKDEGLNLVSSGHTNAETAQVGLYDVLICKSGVPAYFVPIEMGPTIE